MNISEMCRPFPLFCVGHRAAQFCCFHFPARRMKIQLGRGGHKALFPNRTWWFTPCAEVRKDGVVPGTSVTPQKEKETVWLLWRAWGISELTLGCWVHEERRLNWSHIRSIYQFCRWLGRQSRDSLLRWTWIIASKVSIHEQGLGKWVLFTRSKSASHRAL